MKKENNLDFVTGIVIGAVFSLLITSLVFTGFQESGYSKRIRYTHDCKVESMINFSGIVDFYVKNCIIDSFEQGK